MESRYDEGVPLGELPKPTLAFGESRHHEMLAKLVGYVLVAGGLVLNEWVIAAIASPDRHIESQSVRGAIRLIDGLLVVAGIVILKRPRYARIALKCLLPLVVLAFYSFVTFSILEAVPSLIRPLKLDYAHYYKLKSRFIPDDELVFRNRPGSTFKGAFKGDQYRDSYGVSIAPMSYTAVHDEHGFRNSSIPPGGWDVAVLGDSYVEFGHDEGDTFTGRLTAASGLAVRNLGIGSYSPFHYLTVLKRYGLTPKSRYVLFCFSETNDIADMGKYLRWKSAGEGYGNFNLTGKNFLQRYVMALRDVVFAPVVQALDTTSESTPGDLVTIDLGSSTVKAVFSYKNETRSPDELLQQNEMKMLKELLAEFNSIAAEHRIVPIVLFFPTKAHIYASYTTADSGASWLTIRDQQIAAKGNVESAFRSLCREVGIEFISLTPAFEQAASQGKMLYYPFDTHWNSEGRQIAATVLAERLGVRHVVYQ